MSAHQDLAPGTATEGRSRWLALWGAGLRTCSHFSLRTLRWLLALVVLVYLLFGAAFLVLRHVVLPNIDDYRPAIEAQASRALGVPVTVADVDADWSGLRPRLALTDVQIHRPDGSAALRVPKATAVVSWWSLPLLSLRLYSLEVVAPEIEVRHRADGRYVVAGIEFDPEARGRGGFGDWLFAQREVVVRGAAVRYADDARSAADPAAAPMVLSEVSFLMRNTALHHRLALRATPPAELAERIDLRGDFSHTPVLNRASDWRAWRGELFADFGVADVAAIAREIKLPIEIGSGKGPVRAWLALDHGRLDQLTADVALDGVKLRTAPDAPMLEVQTMRGRVVLRELAGRDERGGATRGHEIAVQGFSLRAADGFELRPTDLSERLVLRADGSVISGAFSASELDLASLAWLGAHAPLSTEHRALLARMEPRGLVRGLRYEWNGPIATPERYTLAAQFSALSLHEQPSAQAPDPEHPHRLQLGTPGFRNLAGEVDLNEKGGRMRIEAGEAALIFPGLFADPALQFETLKAQAVWERKGQGVAVQFSEVAFQNADATGTLAGRYESGGKGPGIVDLTGQLTQADARGVYKYLPLTVPEHTRDWVRQAVLGGGSRDVSVELRGDLWDFPYLKPSEGQFRIAARLKGGKLDFAPGVVTGTPARPAWPALDDIAGDLVFERNGFSVSNASGKALGAQLSRVQGRMADFSDPQHRLEISGQVNAPLRAMLDYVVQSPVNGWLGNAFGDARAGGEARLALRLDLPLAALDTARVRGELALADNELSLDPGLPTLARLNGRIDFNETGASARGVTATALGGPVRIEGSPGAGQALALRIDGTATAAGLKRYAEVAALDRASGSARYSARVAVRGGTVETDIDSDLLGLGLDLPSPLAKPAATTLPLKVRMRPSPWADANIKRDLIELNLGPAIAAVLEREHRNGAAGAAHLVRGAFAVNDRPVLPAEGLSATVNLNTLDLDAWRALAEADGVTAAGATPGAGAGAPDTGHAAGGRFALPGVVAVGLQAGELTLMGKRFDRVTAAVNRRDGAWTANIEAPQASGQVAWRDQVAGHAEAPVVARFRRLSVPASQSTLVTQLLDNAPAREVPALDVEVEDFDIQGKKFGRLALSASNVVRDGVRAWQLDRLSMNSPDASFNATGRWGRESGAANAAQRMQMNFMLEVANVGRFLDRLGVKDTMRDGTAKLEGEVAWRGSPMSIDYPSLGGSLVLSADKGQFLKSDPGVARLLGVLSLQSLTRRMTLDFRDVFSQGFAFDTVRANIALNNGVAATKDFRMRGVAATVLMEGNADIGRETQDLHMIVLPEVNAGGASVVYGLLANPAVGLGTFLAQLFLREPLAKALAHEYRVTGGWSDPHVEKLERKPSNEATAPTG